MITLLQFNITSTAIAESVGRDRIATIFASLLYLLLRRLLGFASSGDRVAQRAQVEIPVLRHEMAILRRQVRRPVYYNTQGRALLAAASRILPRER